MIGRLAFAVLAFCLAAAGPASAQVSKVDLAVSVIETWLVPRYQAFAAAAATQRTAWHEACDGAREPRLEPLREAYTATADAWAAVEHVTTGPVSDNLRSDRINFFPDRKNSIGRNVADVLAKGDDPRLKPEAFAKTTVALQGLPAMERLLYGEDVTFGRRICGLGTAIADNLAAITAEVVEGWTGSDGLIAKLKRGEGDATAFANPDQAAARLLTDLALGLQRMVDLKLLPVIGKEIDKAKPALAEARRSGRSARNLRLAVASLREQARVIAAALPETERARLDQRFETLAKAAEALPADLGQAATEQGPRFKIAAFIAAVRSVQDDVAAEVAPTLGITLGFNALDGD